MSTSIQASNTLASRFDPVQPLTSSAKIP